MIARLELSCRKMFQGYKHKDEVVTGPNKGFIKAIKLKDQTLFYFV